MNGLKVKNNNKRNKNITTFAVVIFFTIVSLFFLNNITNYFYFISSPIQNSLAYLGKETSYFFSSLNNQTYLKKENESLKKERRRMIAEIILLREIEKENEILRKAMDLEIDKDFDLIFARVSSFNFSEDFFIVNKGEDDGVSKGMSVINEKKVIIGQVFETHNNFSKVILITNKDSSFFDARVQRKEETMGIVKGEGEFKLILDLIPKEREIEEGDFIVSMGGVYPEGLPIGRINNVLKIDTEPFQKAEVLPLFNPKTTRNIFIIKN